MKRFLHVLAFEIKRIRTAIPVHLVAIIQPTAMYLVMSAILVHPTFDMYIAQTDTQKTEKLVAAMKEVGSPIGLSYINPIIVEYDSDFTYKQLVMVEDQNGQTTVTQHFGLVDSNMVKNFRNRLTAAVLRLWNDSLGNQVIQIEEHPWFPKDIPYTLFFGMSMLPLTVTLAASITGGILTAQEFEFGTILESRLAPASPILIIGARLVRLVLTGLVSSIILMITLYLLNGIWPSSTLVAVMILFPVSLIAGCLGVSAGLILKKSIPTFLVSLVVSFVTWLLGSAFGLAAGFSASYQFVSRLTPNTHAVDMLFPLYFNQMVESSSRSIIYLVSASIFMICLTMSIFHLKERHQG